MVTARPSNRTPAAPRKTTRPTRIVAPTSPTTLANHPPSTTTDEQLACGLDRVLKITQPKPNSTTAAVALNPSSSSSASSSSSSSPNTGSSQSVMHATQRKKQTVLPATYTKSSKTLTTPTSKMQTATGRQKQAFNIPQTQSQSQPTQATPPSRSTSTSTAKPSKTSPSATTTTRPSTRRKQVDAQSRPALSKTKASTAIVHASALPLSSISTAARSTTSVRRTPTAQRPAASTSKVEKRPPTAPLKSVSSSTPGSSTLSLAERVRRTMEHVNEIIQKLSEASKSGYTYPCTSSTTTMSSSKPSSSKGVGQSRTIPSGPTKANGGEWTDAKVAALFDDVAVALRELRRLAESAEMKERRVDIEKAAMGAAMRCINVKMYRKALDFIADARPNLLKMYSHNGISSIPPISTSSTSISKSSSNKVSKGDNLHEGNNGIIGSIKTSASLRYKPVPPIWSDVMRLPKPIVMNHLDNSVRHVLFQSLVYGYIALTALQDYDVTNLLLLPRESPYSHPFQLALGAPLQTVTPLLHLLYRRISDQLKSSTIDPDYIRFHTIALLSLATSISAKKDESSNTPAQLWSTVLRTATSIVEKTGGGEMKLKSVNELIENVVDWVSEVVVVKKEDAVKWQEGNSWVALMDFWASVGHKLNDSEIIDRALVGMVDAVSITSEVQIEEKMTPNQAQSTIYRLSAILAKINLMLEENLNKSREIETTLINEFDFKGLLEAFIALENNEDDILAFGKGLRSLERVRRYGTRIIEKSDREQLNEISGSILSWLEQHVDLVEKVIRASPPILFSTPYDLIKGAIDSTLFFLKWTTSNNHLTLATRSYQLCASTRSIVSTRINVQWLIDIGVSTWNATVRRWNAKDGHSAVELARASCEWVTEAKSMARFDDEVKSSEVPPDWERAFGMLLERWDHCACMLELQGDQEAAISTWLDSLSSLSTPLIEKITTLAATTSISSPNFFPATTNTSTTADANLNALQIVIRRLSANAIGHPEVWEGKEFAKTLVNQLINHGDLPTAVIGVIVERLISFMMPSCYRTKVPGLILNLAMGLLEVYTEVEFPVRRMRLQLQILELVATTGIENEQLPEIDAEIVHLANIKELNKDQSLSHFQSELKGRYLILKALNAYHIDLNPSITVYNLSNEAITELRQLILPNSSSSAALNLSTSVSRNKRDSSILGSSPAVTLPPKTPLRAVSEPARRVGGKVLGEGVGTPVRTTGGLGSALAFDNLKLLSEQLNSLAALLGLLGHVMLKIDVLKLLRALQRNHDYLINEYTLASAELGTEYTKLGKRSRANLVFTQAIKHASDCKVVVGLGARVNLHLRHSHSLALMGRIEQSREEFFEAKRLSDDIEPPAANERYQVQTQYRLQSIECAALSQVASLALRAAEDNVISPVDDLAIIYRLYARGAEICSRLAPESTQVTITPNVQEDPFIAPPPPPRDESATGANEPSKDSIQSSFNFCLAGRHLGGLQWHFGESLLNATLSLASSYAHRGSVKDSEYYLSYANKIAKILKSNVFVARSSSISAGVKIRQRDFESASLELEVAVQAVGGGDGEAERDGMMNVNWNGPDMVDVKRAHGDLLYKQDQEEEACEIFAMAVQDIAGLEALFVATEALIPSPKKNGIVAHPSLNGASKEPLLPVALGHILRQHAWLLRQSGSLEESDELLRQIKCLPISADSKADQLYLEGRIAMHEARNHFKADLFLNSLNESTIAMPMNNPKQQQQQSISLASAKISRLHNRQSTRSGIQLVLQRAEEAFISTLATRSMMGKVEDVRQACMMVALLRAYQTSLGYGSASLTASAAGILASSSAITLKSELMDAINHKFVDITTDRDLKWPTLDVTREINLNSDLDEEDERLRAYWSEVQSRHINTSLTSPGEYDISSLPSNWAVVSINLTDDRKTLFISRHQAHQEPLVFCIPLDRQGKREGEEDDELFSFEKAQQEFNNIIEGSIGINRRNKDCVTIADKQKWWADRRALDDRLGKLVENIEFYWLGAFKTILSPRTTTNTEALKAFKERIDHIFRTAISATGSELKRGMTVPLNDPLLHCFAKLPSKCKDEEIEDFIYFILDLYQSHGISVALSELDLDQIGVDVRNAFSDLENAHGRCEKNSNQPSKVEHLLLALDKNVQIFPWESIPMLRGRPVSRIPSLPFLLDQVALGKHLRTIPTSSQDQPMLVSSHTSSINLRNDQERNDSLELSESNKQFQIDAKKTFYILNPSGDLKNTQQYFTPWFEKMALECGWKGIVGRPPTELELAQALREYDLVLYFGHGGAEQYIRSHKIRHLPKCATTMLWGCSSGILRDQGDFDCSGTPWNYVMAGCPSLVANLWDVTDRDIDRLSEAVCKKFQLEPGRINATGTVSASAAIVDLSTSLSSDNSCLKSKSSKSFKSKKINSNSVTSNSATTTLASSSSSSFTSPMSVVEAVNASRDECKLRFLTGAAPVVYGIPVYLK